MSGSGRDWGNYDDGHFMSLEIFDPKLKKQCKLQDFWNILTGHTMDGLLRCGGGWRINGGFPNKYSNQTARTCDTITIQRDPKTNLPKYWNWNKVEKHKLTLPRIDHCSWAVDDGVLLMGGDTSETIKTTELAKYDGSVQKMFDLKEPVK